MDRVTRSAKRQKRQFLDSMPHQRPARPRRPGSPCWTGLDRDSYLARLGELRTGPIPCSARNMAATGAGTAGPSRLRQPWELSTLAAEWHRSCGGKRSGLAGELELYDRWLPEYNALPGRYHSHVHSAVFDASATLWPDFVA